MDVRNLRWAGTDAQRLSAKEVDKFRLVSPTNSLDKLAGELDDHFTARVARCGLAINWMDFCLNALTRLYVYGNGPTRSMEFPGSCEDWYKKFFGSEIAKRVEDDPIPFNVIMRQIHEECILHGTVLARPEYDEVTESMQLWIYNPWQFDVAKNEFDSRRADAIKITTSNSLADTKAATSNTQEEWEIWTPEGVYNQLGDEISFGRDNKYGFLPFVRVARDPMFYDFFTVGIAEVLKNACEKLIKLDMEQCDLMYHLYSQPVVSGEESKEAKGKQLYVGKGTPIWLEAGASYNRVAAAVQMTSFNDGYQAILNKLAMSIGLSPAAFNMKVYEARDPSGKALEVAQTGPLDSREADQTFYIGVEQRIVTMTANMMAIEKSESVDLWLPSSYEVKFPSVAEVSESGPDKREKARLALEKNLLAPWRALKELYPALSDEEAQARVTEARPEDEASPVNSVHEQIALWRMQIELGLTTLETIAAQINPSLSGDDIKRLIEAAKTETQDKIEADATAKAQE